MWDKVKSWMGGKWVLLLLGVVGAILLAFGGAAQTTSQTESGESGLYEAYCIQEEARLARICSAVAGVGRVEVGITFEGEFAVKYSSGKQVGETVPIVSGVVVVCEGGASDSVRSELTKLISALYNLPSNHIHIAPMR